MCRTAHSLRMGTRVISRENSGSAGKNDKSNNAKESIKELARVSEVSNINEIIDLSQRVLQSTNDSLSICDEVCDHIRANFGSLRVSSVRTHKSEGILVECSHCSQGHLQMSRVAENGTETLAQFFGVL